MAVLLAEPDVAVIVAVPLPFEVTRPADETVAFVASDVVHVTVGLTIVLSFASFTVGTSVAVSPPDTCHKDTLVGDSVTELGT